MVGGGSPSGHALVMDGPPDFGGRNLGPRPMELLLLGMGGCTEFDVLTILRKARQEVTGCEVELEAERAAEDPKVFTRIHAHFLLTGDITEREACRAGHRPQRREVLFRLHHARGDRPDHPHDYEIREG